MTPSHHSGRSNNITGNQLRDSLLRWLSPPDPSTNYNIACKAHHNGTAEWFSRGSIFSQWKSTGSFLWIHGKRASHLTFTMCESSDRLMFLVSIAGSGKSVLWFASPWTLSTLVKFMLLFQFLDHKRYLSFVRCWKGLDGLLLFRFQGRR